MCFRWDHLPLATYQTSRNYHLILICVVWTTSKMRKRHAQIQIVKGKSCSYRQNRLENMACKVIVGAVHLCNSLILHRVLPLTKKGLDT